MKIRRGFVTNSSSSCFITIVKDEDYDAALSEVDEVTRCVVESVMMADNILGQDVMTFTDIITMGGTMWGWLRVDCDIDHAGYPGEIMDEFLSKIRDKWTVGESW